jgi:hypothetical protein
MGHFCKYPDTYEWLSMNITEGDCKDWYAQIEEVSENGL